MSADDHNVYSVSEAADYISTSFWGDASYTFALGPDRALSVNLQELPADAQQIAQWALDAWSTVTGITFTSTTGTADIAFDDNFAGAFAGANLINNELVKANVNVSARWIADNGTDFNSYSTMTYIHEIGHALGLGHPSDYSQGAEYGVNNDYDNDSWQLSAMSYFSQRDNTFIDASYAFVSTPMLADIAAIQSLYGDIALRTGNTVYGDGSTAGGTYDRLSEMRAAGTLGAEVAWAILDDGGYDVLDVSSSNADQTVDLRPEQMSSVYGLNGNLAIERGSVIEEVRTGAGDDLIMGRDAAMTAVTGAGDDTVYGGAQVDQITATAGDNMILTYAGNDRLIAGEGADTLAGGADNDYLLGNGGNDLIYLGFGDDFTGGGAGNDVIYGGAGANVIYGGAGNDTVYGGVDSDLIFGGGNGSNTLLGQDSHDTITGGDGVDLIGGGEGDDMLFGGAGNDLIYLGFGDDFTGAGNGNDQIIAGAGRNDVYGGLGDDTLQAGVGRDLLVGGAGADVFAFTSVETVGIGLVRDVIADFEAGIDRIDLSAMNLRFGTAGSVGDTTGDLSLVSGFVVGDVDRDGTNDFAIRMFGAPELGVDDFIL